MGVFPLAVAAKPCLCQTAFGSLKMGWDSLCEADLSLQEAPIKREGEMVGVEGPAMHTSTA